MSRLEGPPGPFVASLMLVGLGVAAAVALRAARLLDVVEVRGRSMAPALLPGDRLLALQLRRHPVPGQIVLAPDPRDPRRELVKRVHDIGPDGVVEVRGDNPAFSTDARTFGGIAPGVVRWHVVARIWPMHRLGGIGRRVARASVREGGEGACPMPEHLLAG